MKILIHTNAPWQHTGYGRQAALLIPRLLADGYEVVVSCVSGLDGGEVSWPVDGTSDDDDHEFDHRKTIRVLPRGQFDFGVDTLPAYIADERPDLVLTLMDCRMLGPIASVLASMEQPLLCWVPSDTEPLSCPEGAFLHASGATAVAMTRFGQSMLSDAGLDASYVPHAVDTRVFRPLDIVGHQSIDRERLGIPTELFVVGMVAANHDAVRKGFPEQFEAFRRFHEDHRDAHLVVHTVAQSQHGHDLVSLAADIGLGDQSVSFSSPLPQVTGRFDDAHMASLYRSFDVLSACSYAEGFGIPMLEAQSCGTPVLSTNFGAMAEVNVKGFVVDAEPFWNPVHRSWWARPSIDMIVSGYEMYYGSRNSNRLRVEKIRQCALSYDIDDVYDRYWRPLLEKAVS
jgi:glycosyltransferase involved in cell wall biosynthesis